MKRILAAAVLCLASASAMANTYFQIADLGQIELSKDGSRLGVEFKGKPMETYHIITTQHQNGCDVGIYQDDTAQYNLFTVTVCDNDQQFAKFSRYEGETRMATWKVDITRYMSIK